MEYIDELARLCMTPYEFDQADTTVRGLWDKILAINNSLLDLDIPARFFYWAEKAMRHSHALAKLFDAEFRETGNPATGVKNDGHKHYREVWCQMIAALGMYKLVMDAQKAAGGSNLGKTDAAQSSIAAGRNAVAIAAMSVFVTAAIARAAAAVVGT